VKKIQKIQKAYKVNILTKVSQEVIK